MKNLAIIGAGQIGSRHLQALAKISVSAKLHVVDPSPDSLKVAEARYNELPNNAYISSTNFLQSLSQLPPRIDFAVIASSADVRLQIIRELFRSVEVDYLLLEKILFQSEKELDQAIEVLEKQKVKTWVNCNKRLFPIYQKIKSLYQSQEKTVLTVEGGDWGLACNAIHFIDLLVWLTGDSLLTMETGGLDGKLYPSKRGDNVEVCGLLAGTLKNGSRFSLTSTEGVKSPVEVRVETDRLETVVEEGSGELVIRDLSQGDKETKLQLKTPYQSELTQKVAESVFQEQTPGLTTLEESAKQHRSFLKAMHTYIEEIKGEKLQRCPIT